MQSDKNPFRPKTGALVTGSAVCTLSIWLFCIAGQVGAQDPHRRRTGEEMATRNERDHSFQGVITGRVTLNDGKPAVGFPVAARFEKHQTGAQGEGEAITDANGDYRIHGLNPQGFWVQAQNGGKPYVPDPPRLVRLEKSPDMRAATHVDFHLRLGPQVTVRVRDAQTGVPVPGVGIAVSPMLGSGGLPRGVTDKTGTFRFRADSLTIPMNLETTGRHLSAAPGYGFYRTFKLPQVQDVVWEVRVYHDDAPQRTTFQGVVTGPDRIPVWGAKVRMIRNGMTTQARASDPAGHFTFDTYRMQASEYGNWNGRNQPGIRIEAEKGKLHGVHYATPEETWTSIPVRLDTTTEPASPSRTR